jgi:exonuclease SbcC
MQASTFILDNLVDDINDYLALLEVPFRVKTKEGSMTLTAIFGDTELPDQLLSGGQRVAISIAMKLAILRLLGGKLRFIALDEPTAFLDNARIAGLRELMRRINEICRNEGTKLLVISHCPEIQSAFDNVVQLG